LVPILRVTLMDVALSIGSGTMKKWLRSSKHGAIRLI